LGCRTAICYFSGTGNTAYVVKLAEEAFASHGVAVDLYRIEDLCRGTGPQFCPADYDMFGISHPVLGFDSPSIIYRWVRSLPDVEDKLVFLLKTAADYHAVNSSASHSVTRILSRKGYDSFYDEIVAMPSNWLVAYDDQLNRQLVEVARSHVELAVSRILLHERKATSNKMPLRLVLKAASYLEDRVGAKMFARQLTVDSACTRCGRCVRDCPARNIELVDGQVRFGNACLWCMRCVYGCSENAIRGKYMNLFILNGGYDLPRIAALPVEPIDFADPRLPMWHRYFKRYFSE
jgi:ferredoxin